MSGDWERLYEVQQARRRARAQQAVAGSPSATPRRPRGRPRQGVEKRLGTYSLTPEAHLLLEQTVLSLRIAGTRVDKSSLIEALIRRSNTMAVSGDVETLRHWVDAELGRPMQRP